MRPPLIATRDVWRAMRGGTNGVVRGRTERGDWHHTPSHERGDWHHTPSHQKCDEREDCEKEDWRHTPSDSGCDERED